MPGDATHVKSAKWVSVVAGIILYGLGVGIVHIIGMIALFLFCVMYLSPDLDMWNTEPTKRWGKLKILWSVFEKRVDHRSRWSHGWIVGFIVIHTYFLVILSIAVALLRMFWLPLIEPLIDVCNNAIDDIVSLNFTPELMVFFGTLGLVALAAFWHHKILDTLVKN